MIMIMITEIVRDEAAVDHSTKLHVYESGKGDTSEKMRGKFVTKITGKILLCSMFGS